LHISEITWDVKLFNLLIKSFSNAPMGSNYYWLYLHFPYSAHSSNLFLNLDISLLFHVLSLLPSISRHSNVHNEANSLFLINHHSIKPLCFNHIVTLYIYVPEKFDFVIIYGTFWNVVIPFYKVFKVIFLAQIPMNLLSNIIVSSLVFFLSKFLTSTDYVLHTLSTLSTHSARGLSILLSMWCFTMRSS